MGQGGGKGAALTEEDFHLVKDILKETRLTDEDIKKTLAKIKDKSIPPEMKNPEELLQVLTSLNYFKHLTEEFLAKSKRLMGHNPDKGDKEAVRALVFNPDYQLLQAGFLFNVRGSI